MQRPFPLFIICAVVLYCTCYIVWAAVTFSCDEVPNWEDRAFLHRALGTTTGSCPRVNDNHVLLTVCLHACSIESNCRAIFRWRAAGWAGRAVVLTDKADASCPASAGLVEFAPSNSSAFFNPPWTTRPVDMLWCDKVRAVERLAAHTGTRGNVLYVDTDLVPARCVVHLSTPRLLSLYGDNLCWECNKFNAGLIWVAGETAGEKLNSLILPYLSDWQETCATSPEARRDDQIALDVMVSKRGASPIPVQLPASDVRYMSSMLWSWSTSSVLWHYTHAVRNRCKITV
eukprot:Rhum_TRINITY_DN122_c0_g1::Rhum_TRINITY_DN122_c0_g1_i1::g.373::m.373